MLQGSLGSCSFHVLSTLHASLQHNAQRPDSACTMQLGTRVPMAPLPAPLQQLWPSLPAKRSMLLHKPLHRQQSVGPSLAQAGSSLGTRQLVHVSVMLHASAHLPEQLIFQCRMGTGLTSAACCAAYQVPKTSPTSAISCTTSPSPVMDCSWCSVVSPKVLTSWFGHAEGGLKEQAVAVAVAKGEQTSGAGSSWRSALAQ